MMAHMGSLYDQSENELKRSALQSKIKTVKMLIVWYEHREKHYAGLTLPWAKDMEEWVRKNRTHMLQQLEEFQEELDDLK